MRGAVLACVVALAGCSSGPKTPTVESCSALPILDNYREPDAITLPLRFENNMGPLFHAEGVCISIDGRRIRQDDPDAIIAGFAAHRSLELRPMLRPGVPHHVNVVVIFAGRGAIQGYKFSVSSVHKIGVPDPMPEALSGELLEKSGGPVEEHPTVKWTEAARQVRSSATP